MPLIQTKVDRNSDDFAANAEVNTALARDLAALSEQVMQGGSERSRERHVKRGKIEDPILHADDIVLVPEAFF